MTNLHRQHPESASRPTDGFGRPAPHPRLTRRAGGEPGGPVLLVDDEPFILASLRRILRRAGTPVVLASSVDEATEALADLPIRCVVSDLMMPGGGAQDLLEWVAAHRPELQTRFAVMTGAALGSSAQGFAESQRVPVFTKPLALSELLAWISDHPGGDERTAVTAQ